MRAPKAHLAPVLLAAVAAVLSASATAAPSAAITIAPTPDRPALPGAATATDFNAPSRSGRDIYDRFRSGLAEPTCSSPPNTWTRHFSTAPQRLSNRNDNTLALFGHVVDSVRAAHLPTEYALIPFVESGYKSNARSAAGPAGMWQMISSTARNHHVPMRPGYDGRLSPVDSTRAAVRYLKTLNGMFGGNWRLAVMAYNVGEGRVFGALKRSGQSARTARPESLAGLPDITRVYDDKLHAISCLMVQANSQPRWLASLDRPVARLATVTSSDDMVNPLPRGRRGQPSDDSAPAMVAMMGSTPAPDAASSSVFASGSAAAALGTRVALVVASTDPLAAADTPRVASLQTSAVSSRAVAGLDAPVLPTVPATQATLTAISNAQRRHTVAVGESLWRIARRYGVSVADLVGLNAPLDIAHLLAPGTVLAIGSLGIASK